MIRSIILILIIVAVMFIANGVSAQFYYGGGDSIPIGIDSTKVLLKFNLQTNQQSILTSIDRFVSVVPDDHTMDGFIACSLSTGSDYDDFLDSVQAISGIYLAEPYYIDSQDSAFLVGITFCVAFDSTLSNGQIDSINTARWSSHRP